MKRFLIESPFLLSFSERDEETIPVIISPHQTISASLGKDHVTHGGACNLKPGAPDPCVTHCACPRGCMSRVETLPARNNNVVTPVRINKCEGTFFFVKCS